MSRSRRTTTVSDRVVLRHLKNQRPEEVAAWVEILQRKLEKYIGWGLSNFTVHDRERGVRIVVRDRTVVTVLPKRRHERRGGGR